MAKPQFGQPIQKIVVLSRPVPEHGQVIKRVIKL